jgi:beta-mannanase
MPTKDARPSQTSKLIQCQLSNKKEKNCPTFEDYYPGEKYVDIMGFTFYNRGKASYNRAWMTPTQIVNEKGWNILSRIKTFKKPIFIDEVATTAVRYDDAYNAKKSREAYLKDSVKKNKRIRQLQQMVDTESSIL